MAGVVANEAVGKKGWVAPGVDGAVNRFAVGSVRP
jgi:hypothetical protein